MSAGAVSYYTATAAPHAPFPLFEGEADCDVCIIGGGYTGLMAALELAERGVSVRLIEAEHVAFGASGRNGGQLGSGHRQDQPDLEARYGVRTARVLWALAEEAKALAKARIAKHAIACDLKPGVLQAAHRARYVTDLFKEAEHLQKVYDYRAVRTVSKIEMSEMLATTVYYGGILDMGAAHFHPLNYALGLARAAAEAGALIHERTRALAVDFDSGLVRTAHGRIRAEFVLLACNAYLDDLAPPIAPQIMPINSYIVATEPLGDRARALIRDDVSVCDTRFVINYYRLSADGRMLYGGRETYTAALLQNFSEGVRARMVSVFPQLKDVRIDYAWGGTLAITPNRLAHLGRLGKRGLFAQGYSGHGVALAGLAGKLMAEAMSGSPERFNVFADLGVPRFPGGTMLRGPLRLLAMLYGKLRDAL